MYHISCKFIDRFEEVRINSEFKEENEEREREILLIYFHNVQRSRHFRYSEDPPLDDEAEELLYIRELVASKFYEPSSSKCEDASGKTSSVELPRSAPCVRRVDLSAPKFRMSQRRRQRRRDDWSSLEYEDTDDRGSRERAPLTEAPSKDSSRDADEATMRGNRARERRRALSSSAAECELIRARGNTCRIQTGPSLHIVDRELSRQDLEDVHISPEPSWAQSRANTANYALRHGVTVSSTSPNNEVETSRTSRTVLRARLGSLRREKRDRLIDSSANAAAAEAPVTTDASSVPEKRGAELEQDDQWTGQSKSRAQGCIREEGQEDRESDLRDETEETGIPLARLGAANCAVAADSGNGNEKSKRKNGNQAEVTVRDDTVIPRYAGHSGGTSNKRSDIDKQAAARLHDDESAADEIREENQGDRSKPPFPAGENTLRKTGFLRRDNTATSHGHRAAEGTRAIDECLSNNTYDSHSEQTSESCDVAGENMRRRSFISRSPADRRAEDDLSEVDLYQPRLDHLDLILSANEERLGRVTRVARNFAELLSRPEFARYKLDDEQRTPREYHASPDEFYRESVAHEEFEEKEIPLVRSQPISCSVLETELRNDDLTISPTAETQRCVDASLQKVFVDAEAKSTKEVERDRDDTKNSVEFSTYRPTSNASDVGFGSSNDEAARFKAEARFSETSMDKSDVTTFSNMLPALSSTRTTEAQTCRRYLEEQIVENDRQADAKRQDTAINRPSRRDIDPFRKRQHSDNIFSQVLRGLRNTSGSATDRVIAYILQDEKQSVERKIRSALKGSAITPVAVQKLLDRLREIESIRSAHQTETLGILKNILINIKSEAEKANRHDKEVSLLSHLSVRADRAIPGETEKLISRKGNQPQLQMMVDDTSEMIEEIKKNSQHLKHRDINSFNFSANHDAQASVRSETLRSEATAGSKNNNGSKGDLYSEVESLKQISDIRSNDEEDPGKDLPHLSAKTASVKSSKTEVNTDIATAASRTEESDVMEKKTPGDVTQEKKNLADGDIAQVIVGETIDVRLNNSAEASVAVKEISREEAHEDVTSMSKKRGSPVVSSNSEMKEKEIQSNASSAKSKFLGKALKERKNNALGHSPARGDAGSPRAIEDDVNSQHPVAQQPSPVKSCSADSLRGCASLSSAKNSSGSSLKENPSPLQRVSLNIEGENKSMKDTRDETGERGTMTRMKVENGDFELLKSAENANDDVQQLIPMANISQRYKKDMLLKIDSSNSSVSSALLDHEDR